MGLLSKIKKTVSKVSTVTSAVKSAVSGGVSSAVNKVSSGVSKVVNKVTDTVSNVKSFVSDGYLKSAVIGAVQGFATGGIAGAVVGAGAGMVSNKLSRMSAGDEVIETVDISEGEDANTYALDTVDGFNAYMRNEGQDLMVDSSGVVYNTTTGAVVGQYDFSTYSINPPTELTKTSAVSPSLLLSSKDSGISAVGSGSGSGWKAKYNQTTASYWSFAPGVTSAKKNTVSDSANAK